MTIKCFGGLDLSRVNDFTALTLTWVLDDTPDEQVFKSKTWFWTPKATLAERAARDGAPYDVWARQGYIEAVEGQRIQYKWVAEALGEICAIARPEEIGCDQYGLENLREHLGDSFGTPLTIHPQGFQKRVIEKDAAAPEGEQEVYLWMPHSINKLEAAVYDRRITIDSNPMMNTCAANVVYSENRTGHRMFDKGKAFGRIDGMVSLAMSIGVATCREKSGSVATPWDTDPEYRLVV